jgi:hypothetical protein
VPTHFLRQHVRSEFSAASILRFLDNQSWFFEEEPSGARKG